MEQKTNKEKIVFVKTYYIPNNIPFRYKSRWWKKRKGCVSKAIAVDSDLVSITLPCGIVVGMLKKDLPEAYRHGIIKEL